MGGGLDKSSGVVSRFDAGANDGLEGGISKKGEYNPLTMMYLPVKKM